MTKGVLDVEVLAPDGSVIRPPGSGRLGSRSRLALVALAVLALAGTVAFAVSRLTATSGPQSPEAAVDRFLEAAAAGDLLGILAVLRPAERQSLGEPLLDVVDQLRRLDVVGDDLDLGAIGGVSIAVDDVDHVVESLDDGLALVTTTGTVTSSIDLAELPLGGVAAELAGGDGTDADGTDGDPGGGPAEATATIATVREGDRWYVSLWYTLAESARSRAGQPFPDARAVQPVGAETPDGVVAALLDAATALDPAAALALVDPEEAAAAYDYSALFLPAAAAAIGDLRDELGLEVTVSGVDLDVDRDGAAATVTFGAADDLVVNATWEDPRSGFGSVSLRDGCLALVQGSLDQGEICADGLGALVGLPLLGSADPAGGADGPRPGVVVVERDGRWYLSPGRTVLGAVVDSLAGLESSDLSDLAAFGADLRAGPGGLFLPPGGGWSPYGGDATEQLGGFDNVAVDDPRVAAIVAGLPAEVAGLAGESYFDDAYVQRFADRPLLTVTRVFQLTAGFADVTVTEGGEAVGLGEPIEIDGQPATIDRFGDGVIVGGRRNGFALQVSVFGLDRGLDPADAAVALYAASGAHLDGLPPG